MNAFRGQHRQPKIVSSGHTLVTENLVPVGRNGSGWTVWTTGLDCELWKCIRPHHLDGLGKGSSPPSDTSINSGHRVARSGNWALRDDAWVAAAAEDRRRVIALIGEACTTRVGRRRDQVAAEG